MSWLSKSLTGFLQDGDDEFGNESSNRDDGKSVKEDLSELGRHLWGGVASFLAPPPQVKQEKTEDDDGPEIVEKDDTEENQVQAEESNSPTHKLAGFQSDLAELKGGFAKGLSRLSSVIRVVTQEENDNEDDKNLKSEENKQSLPARIVSGIDGISKLASSIFPFVQEDDAQELWEAPGITDEVVAFARNISKHPETWLDFPNFSDDQGFEMNSSQQEHIHAVQQAASRLEALRCELCPEHISENRFWKIYFVLLHSRLSEQDTALLSTPQVLEARKLLLDHLKKQEKSDKTSPVDELSVIDKDAIESTIKLAPTTSHDLGEVAEAEADEWLHGDHGVENAPTKSSLVTAGSNRMEEEDISFSDLEDDEDAGSSSKGLDDQAAGGGNSGRATQDWVQLDSSRSSSNGDDTKKHERAGSNDWLTVDQEDVNKH